MTEITYHKDYSDTVDTVQLVRDCIEGEPTIKRKTTTYLKHPNPFDQKSTEQKARYEKYIDGAEFDGIPAMTEKSMLGLMTGGEANIELPEKITYLQQNADGDGMPLMGLAETIYKNLLEVKFHLLVAEFQGLADLEIDKLSIADLKTINPRASIKQYTRESLVDWQFSRLNSVMQLSMVLLLEQGSIRSPGELIKSDYTSYLMLALDENGDYFQRRFVKDADGNFEKQNDHYPVVGGTNLKWLPVEIVADEEMPSNFGVPKGMGFLYPICSKALSAYRISADYKETLATMQPTLFGSGWKDGDAELFERLNGRKFIAFGANVSNSLPDGVTVDVVSLAGKDEAFTTYLENNRSQSRTLGGKIDNENSGIETATKSGIDNRNDMAAMLMIVKNTEAALKRVMSYCAMYEGLWGQDDVETNLDQIILDLPVEFAKSIMSAEEVNSTISAHASNLISRDEAIRKLVAGGFTISDSETIMDELDNQSIDPAALPIGNQVVQENQNNTQQ
jgi:hypothetical protein